MNRRTVLKTIGATVAGSTVLAGTAAAQGPHGQANGQRSILELVATHDHETHEHGFTLSSATIPSGWTTIRLDNPTEHPHFVYASKAPQQAIDEANAAGEPLLDYWVSQVTNPFQGFMDLLAGKPPSHPIVFPTWFTDGSVVPSGGPGLVSGGGVAATTEYLAPGEYILECYVKDEHDEFHGYNGMIELLTVTAADAGVAEPSSTLDVSVSTGGFVVDGTPRPGRHTIGVTFEDFAVYANLVGHDLHLIRLDDGTTAADVNDWMNWMIPGGLVGDENAPGTWLGGVQDMAGGTAYVHATLTPGDYAIVAEIPDPASKGLLVEFSVPTGAQ